MIEYDVHDGKAEDEDDGEVDKDKCGSAILSGNVRETPDIPKPDCRTRSRQYKSDPASPMFPLDILCHFSHTPPSFSVVRF